MIISKHRSKFKRFLALNPNFKTRRKKKINIRKTETPSVDQERENRKKQEIMKIKIFV